jgi:hypothetical protein
MAFTFDSSKIGSGITLSNNNLTISTAASYNGSYSTYNALSNTALTSGKYYCELLIQTASSCFGIGVVNELFNINSDSLYSTSNYISYFVYNGNVYPGNTAYGASLTTGDILGIAIDIDNKKIKFTKNGTWYADLTLPSGNSYYIYVTDGASNGGVIQLTANFGSNMIFKYKPAGYLPCDSTGIYSRIKTSISNVKTIGDMISCRYTASSGYMGAFSEFGTTSALLIPTASSAAPDGAFYWIYVGKDALGRMKFIADRNVQNSIAWDVLNSNEVVNEFQFIFSSRLNLSYNTHTIQSGTLYTSATYITCGSINSISDGLTNEKGNTPCINGTVANTGFISVDIGSSKIVTYLVLKNMSNKTDSNAYNTMYVKNFKLQGSNTGGTNTDTWVDIYTGITSSANYGNIDKFSFTNTTAYRYYRIYFIDNWGYASYKSIASMELYTSNVTNIYTSYNYYTKLLAGATSTTDVDNEWDKIIASSTLGGLISAGDNNIWNWNTVYSWTSTTQYNVNTNRICMGGTAANTCGTGNASSAAVSTIGYRPVLIVEILAIVKYLLAANSNYYSIDPTHYDSVNHVFTPLTLTGGTTPNKSDIDTFGFNDLSVLINNMTVSSDTFRPIDKLNNVFQINKYTNIPQ